MKKSFNLSVRELVEMAMLVALAIILDFDTFKIPVLAGGGSISLTMVPLFVLAFRHGIIKSFIGIGIVYGFTTCLLDNYGLHTYPLDYLLGFGSIALASIFSKYLFKNDKLKYSDFLVIAIGVIIGSTGRLFFSTISGMVIYGEETFMGSLLLNLSYIGPSACGVLIALALLTPALKIIEKHFPINNKQKWQNSESKEN